MKKGFDWPRRQVISVVEGLKSTLKDDKRSDLIMKMCRKSVETLGERVVWEKWRRIVGIWKCEM